MSRGGIQRRGKHSWRLRSTKVPSDAALERPQRLMRRRRLRQGCYSSRQTRYGSRDAPQPVIDASYQRLNRLYFHCTH
jgi:hypothetical protein